MTTDPTKEFLPELSLAKIAQHPDNPRHDVGDVTDLAASIKDHGVLEPLVVVPLGSVSDDLKVSRAKAVEYALIAGHRRLAAAKAAKVKTVPVVVRHDLATREEQVAAMVIENQHRADLSPVEEGEAYQLLLDITPKSTQATVAAAVGMPKKRVSERVRLTKLGDAAKAAIHDGQITLSDALEVLAIEKRHPDLAQKVTLAAGSPDFKYELTRAKQDADVLDRYDQCRAKAEELDTVILDKAPGYNGGQPRRVHHYTRGITVPDGLAEAAMTDAIGEAHAACPGAAVWIPKQASALYELGWYCTAFDDHHLPTDEEQRAARAEADAEWEREQAEREQARLDGMTGEERAEEERAAAERAAAEQAHAERKAALDAAQATRQRHFHDIINQGEPALAKLALLEICTTFPFEHGTYINTDLRRDVAVMDLLGLDPLDKPDVVTDQLRRLTADQLVLLLWFSATQGVDDSLTVQSWQRGEPLTPDPDYIRVLTDRYGYKWSTAEIEEFNLDEHGHVRTDDEGAAGAGDAA